MTIYLYVKTHNKTGLKYLGKTIAKDPYKYPGSGVYWSRHLKKHGKDYTTEIIKECETQEEVAKWGLHYTNLWNIVDAKDNTGRKIWANIKPETGDGGSAKGHKKSEATREKHRNKVWSQHALDNLKNIGIKSAQLRKGKEWSENKRIANTNAYFNKNLPIAIKVFDLFENNKFSIHAISKELKVDWFTIKNILNRQEEFKQRILGSTNG